MGLAGSNSSDKIHRAGTQTSEGQVPTSQDLSGRTLNESPHGAGTQTSEDLLGMASLRGPGGCFQDTERHWRLEPTAAS